MLAGRWRRAVRGVGLALAADGWLYACDAAGPALIRWRRDTTFRTFPWTSGLDRRNARSRHERPTVRAGRSAASRSTSWSKRRWRELTAAWSARSATARSCT